MNFTPESAQPLVRASQVECARNIRWMLGFCAYQNGVFDVDGWAITLGGDAEKSRFLLNGVPFEAKEYPVTSPDIGEFFWSVPEAVNARFYCRTVQPVETVFPNGFARMDFVTSDADDSLRENSAWYLPGPGGPILPDLARIERVIGAPDTQQYLLGGATLFNRFDTWLTRFLSRPIAKFPRVLDWGCGSGRVSRYFHALPDVQLTGVDIDPDNIAWCSDNFRHGQYLHINAAPPTPFADNSFDFIFGVSVVTHLGEESQRQWMKELHRILSPGGVVILSIQGPSQVALNRLPEAMLQEAEDKGFLVTQRNAQLDDVVPDSGYLDVLLSREYIHREWSRHFAVLGIIDGMAANQDAVVLRKE